MRHWKWSRCLLAGMALCLLVSARVPAASADETQWRIGAATEEGTNRHSAGRRFWVSLGNFYYPTGTKARNRFGHSWGNNTIGFSLSGGSATVDEVRLETSALTESSGNGHGYIYPLTLSYSHKLSRPGRFTPYIGGGVSAVFVDLKSTIDQVDTGTRCVAGGKVFAGLASPRGYLEVHYYGVPAVKGFNLSGIGLSTGINF